MQTYRLSVGMTAICLNDDVRIIHWDDNRCGYRVLKRVPGHQFDFTHKDYDTYLEALVNAL